MKRTVFTPDWFPVKVKKSCSTVTAEYVMDYNSEKNLFEMKTANGRTEVYNFKQLGMLFTSGRYYYTDLGKDGFARPVLTNKDEITAYAKENPTEKVLAFSEKTQEVYSITDTRCFVNGELVTTIPEGMYLLHPCTRFRVFETEKVPEKKSFPWGKVFTAFLFGIVGGGACAHYLSGR